MIERAARVEFYDWAQALVQLASSQSDDINTLLVAAGLDPRRGDVCDIDLSGCDLTGQDLRHWNLQFANLTRANLKSANLSGALVDPWSLALATDWDQAILDESLRLQVAELSPNLLIPIVDFMFHMRTTNLLHKNGIRYVGDLIARSPAELLLIPHLGKKTLEEIEGTVRGAGLQLGRPLKEWPPKRLEQLAQWFQSTRDFY